MDDQTVTGGWPLIGDTGGVTVCEYAGPGHKGEPVEAVRIQLTGRPGRPFLFLTESEWGALKGICRG